MAAIEVTFHRLAAREFRLARDWYAERSVTAAERFVTAVDMATQRMGNAPEALPILFSKYRWVRVRRFPYILIFFQRTKRELRVVAVAHTSRKSGDWRGRK